MVKEKKLSLKKTRAGGKKAEEDFIEEPERKIRAKLGGVFPWEKPEVNERVVKVFNLRLPEPEFLKIKYLVKWSDFNSMHDFCLQAIREKLEENLSEIIE